MRKGLVLGSLDFSIKVLGLYWNAKVCMVDDRANCQTGNHDSGDLTGGKRALFGRLTGCFSFFSLMTLLRLDSGSNGSGYRYGSAENAHNPSPKSYIKKLYH